MKPLHIGLLIVGAALAGGLAMKMTDLQPAPVASSPAIPVVPVLKAAPVSAPAVESVSPQPSPMPRRIAPVLAPVYVEPVHIEPVAPRAKPVVIAKTKPLPPLLPPVPYEPPAQPAAPHPEPQAEPAPPRTATLPAGMTIAVRLNESLSSERGIAGDTFNASLSEPIVIDGLVIAEHGAHARGRIVGTQRPGRVSGMSSLDLELTMVETADGQKVEISTAPWTKRDPSYGAGAAKIGGGAALGAIIGGVAAGGKGAAIGAGAGAVLGAGAAAASRGKPVNVPSETVIRFRLASRVTITERQL